MRPIRIAAPLLALFAAGTIMPGCGDKLLGLSATVEVTPNPIAFGQVGVGVPQEARVSVTNQGSAALSVNTVKVSADPNGELTVAELLTTDCSDAPRTAGPMLSPGECARFTVIWTPAAAHAAAGSIEVDSSDAQSPAVTVPITGTATATPTSTCGSSGQANPVANIRASYSQSQGGSYATFVPSATPSPVIPLDYVQLDGSSSTVASGSPSYTWQLISQPAGSTTALVGSGAQVTFQALVSGTYVASLTVKDSAGCVGTSQVTIQVVPSGDVHVELTWAESCGDLDLHYVAPNATVCGIEGFSITPTDVAYYNANPDWGCATSGCSSAPSDPGGGYADGSTADDASLDHDDQWGNGPENVTQKSPFDSPSAKPYQIWVYYYSNVPDGGGGSGTCGKATPTITVYVRGALVKTITLSGGFTNQQLWHAADVSVSNQASNITVSAADTSPVSGSACSPF